MIKRLVFGLLMVQCFSASAQELNCQVSIITDAKVRGNNDGAGGTEAT